MIYDTKTLEFDKVLDLVLPYCQTNSGKKLIKESHPLNDIDEINRLLYETKEAFEAIIKVDSINLGSLHDVLESIKRSEVGSILNSEEIFKIGELLDVSQNANKYYKSLLNTKVELSNLKVYFESIYEDSRLKDEIFGAINESYEILDNASMSLFKVRRKLQMEENHLRSYMNSLLMSKGQMLRENVVAMRDGRLCLPVKAEYKNSFKGIVHDMSSSGTTFFIEPSEANDIYLKIENLKSEEKKEIEIVLKSLSMSISTHALELKNTFNNLVMLDMIFAKALFAKENDMTMPKMNLDGYINIINGAHPLIDRDKVVRNSLSLGKNYDTIIITGPNTGGKTVVLKLVGLLTLMAQSGFFIPASENSSIAVFDNIFVDIGDDQSIAQNLSTFSSHMKKISNIVDNLTYNSLVLLDEVGSGTDPKEGASLAIAIIDYLTKKGARVITTTHYSDLKAYAYNNDNIINASVEFDSNTFVPTYKLLVGVAGQSNALKVSQKLGLKDEILDAAKAFLNNTSTDSSNLVKKIDEENEKINALKQNLEHKISEYNRKNKELNDELDEIKKNKDLMIYKAKREADLIIKDAKDKSKELLDSINQIKKDKAIEDKDLAQVKYQARTLEIKKNEEINEETLNIGDFVRIAQYNTVGEIIDIKKDKFIVKFGQFKMEFKRNELTLEKKKPVVKKVERKTPVTILSTSKSAKMQLDLRGYRYEEVAPALDLFIDQAYLAKYDMVYIIHGYGTGAVREAVYAFLKKCKHVKSTRFGGEGEGLNGCTVVYLK